MGIKIMLKWELINHLMARYAVKTPPTKLKIKNLSFVPLLNLELFAEVLAKSIRINQLLDLSYQVKSR
jgi:hypothetical protein